MNMKIFLRLFSLALVMIVSVSCFERYLTYENMTQIWVREDPDHRLVLPDMYYPPIDCRDYGKGCQYGIRMKTHGIVIILVCYETESDAITAAIRFNSYYRNNWLFDELGNEPYLADFLIEKMGAKKPKVVWEDEDPIQAEKIFREKEKIRLAEEALKKKKELDPENAPPSTEKKNEEKKGEEKKGGH